MLFADDGNGVGGPGDRLLDADSRGGQTQVFEVRPGGARRRRGKADGKFSGIEIRRKPQRFKVVREYGGPAPLVRMLHPDHAVKASWPTQRGVNGFGAVGRREHENARAGLQAIQERQQLGDNRPLMVCVGGCA